MTGVPRRRADVAIVGSGPAGLTAAQRLARAGADVVVVEREREPGGIPRHSAHTGYGLRDRRRLLSGPAYAARLAEDAVAAGASLATETTVTGWTGPRRLALTGPSGREELDAGAVVLATGARERPRSARLVAGDRPMGVLTTGLLQQLAVRHGSLPFDRAVVVGAELVSWSAVLTLREAGCRVVRMVTEHEVAEAPAPLRLAGPRALGFALSTGTRVARVRGEDRVTGVELVERRGGAREIVSCDVVVFTGSWVPDHELARLAGLQVDTASGSPVVDTAQRTSAPGVFAAGNLVHPVDTADVAALGGAHVAASVARWLAEPSPAPRGVALGAEAPLAWVAPSVLRRGDGPPPRRRLLAASTERRATAAVRLHQDGREIARARLPWAVSPGRILRLPSSLLDAVDLAGGPVRLALA